MRNKYCLFLLLLIFNPIFSSCSDKDIKSSELSDPAFIRGADLSFLNKLEDYGAVFKDGAITNCLQIFKDHGFNYIRLRIWNNPADGYTDKAKTIAMAKRIKALGLKLLLDFHYSDTWADPAHQYKPAAWSAYSFSQLTNAVYDYTADVISSLKAENALPDMVQIGNEITPGMLWPDGRVGGFSNSFTNVNISGSFNSWGDFYMRTAGHHRREITLTNVYPTNEFKFHILDSGNQWYGTNVDGIVYVTTNSEGTIYFPAFVNGYAIVMLNETNMTYTITTNNSLEAKNWNNLTAMLKSGIQAVKDNQGTNNVEIMIHLDRGGDNTACRYFFDKLVAAVVPFDIIGLSYYPWWHGTLGVVQANLNDLAVRYGKDVIIAETSYPWTLDYNDSTNNVVGTEEQVMDGYPDTVVGQKQFLSDLKTVVQQVPAGRGTGVFYWAPDYISAPGFGSSWENMALFDFNGDVLDSINGLQ